MHTIITSSVYPLLSIDCCLYSYALAIGFRSPPRNEHRCRNACKTYCVRVLIRNRYYENDYHLITVILRFSTRGSFDFFENGHPGTENRGNGYWIHNNAQGLFSIYTFRSDKNVWIFQIPEYFSIENKTKNGKKTRLF